MVQDRIDAYVARIVAEAPPLNEKQREVLQILGPTKTEQKEA